MDNEEFMESMKSTWKESSGPYAHFNKEDLSHAVMGLSAEAGELMDEFKKWRYYKDGRSFPQKQMEEEQLKAKREYDAVMNQPKDDDTEKGLGSILGIWKRWWQILTSTET